MSILINNGNDYQLNSSETFNSLKSSPSSTSSLSSISTSSSSSCHKRSKAVDLNRNTSNSQNSSISTAPTTATAANTTPRKTSITIPSKLPSLWIPLRNGNIDYSRYYNTNQEEDNQEQQLQDGEPLSAQPPIMVQQRLQQPMPILYKTLLKPYLVSVQQPTQQSHHLVLIQPIQVQLAMILVFLNK